MASPSDDYKANGGSRAGKNHEFPRPFRGVELQPSETCPKNFVIFDQTDSRSRIMFHPAMAHNFSCPSTHGDNPENLSYTKEEAEDINALLSSGSEEEEDDVVSTGRTPPYWQGGSSSGSEKKREKTRKMVKALRGIIPGGSGMDTPAVLDEAVRYLKSLKVEAKKLGMQKGNK